MRLNFKKVSAIEEKQFNRMLPEQKFKYILTLQQGNVYGWGKENLETADCSGSVCLALMAAYELPIRLTADGLYKKVFNVQPNGIDCLFCVTPTERQHGSRMVKAGTATHVCGFISDGILLDAFGDSLKIKQAEQTISWFTKRGYETHVLGLNIDDMIDESRKKHSIDKATLDLFSSETILNKIWRLISETKKG